MKSILFAIIFSLMAFGVHKPCGKYNGRNIYKGKNGGCYYLKGKNHQKIYIDKKYCKC
ncbi:MAG: hypothetical protein IT243_07155 [Bacteroidia bacterium]|nr:hypothetical protein [Bacteroidia bacterium]